MLLGATSGRLILITRHLLGGFDVAAIRWQDLEEVTLRVGVLGADLGIRAGKATDLASLGAQGAQQVRIPGAAQGSGAGGLPHLPGAGPGVAREAPGTRARGAAGPLGRFIQVGAAAGAGDDAVRRLQEAKQLLDAKLITDAEYEAIKAKIVSS